jgi:hypothetical protein
MYTYLSLWIIWVFDERLQRHAQRWETFLENTQGRDDLLALAGVAHVLLALVSQRH